MITVVVEGARTSGFVAGDGRIQGEGWESPVVVERRGGNEFSVTVGERRCRVVAMRADGTIHLLVDGWSMVGVIDHGEGGQTAGPTRSSGEPHGQQEVLAPMPALVARIEVKPGDEVVAGQPLIVLEAMKMENDIRARHGGIVTAVHVVPGKAVERGELLVTLTHRK
jgi:biotin carboxyl carrier protein